MPSLAKGFQRSSWPGFTLPMVRPNRRVSVPVYRTDLAGKTVEVKFEFEILCPNGSYRYTGRFDRFTGQFDRFTGRFDW